MHFYLGRNCGLMELIAMHGFTRIRNFGIVLLFVFGVQLQVALPASPKRLFASRIDTVAMEHWVDSVMSELSLRERIGQLFMVAAYSNRDKEHVEEVASLVRRERIGGIIFFQGGPVRQAQQTNYYQSQAKVPLLIGIDAEWGLGMRLDSTISYPRQMVIGAARDTLLMYRIGEDIARQLRRIGVHLNFAPVVDVNSNPRNPVIGSRSFGEDREWVTRNGSAYIRALQRNGIIACAKHFPGHGDTDKDSHYSLPAVNHLRSRLDSIELYPFRKLVDSGVMGVMVAHLRIPALEPDSTLPSSLSSRIIGGELIAGLGFSGLVFSDAMNMKGVASYYEPVEANVKALLAGNDVLLFPDQVKRTVRKIERMVKRGRLPEEAINIKCRKVLMAKYFAGLNRYKPIRIQGVFSDLNKPSSVALRRSIYRKAITLVSNSAELLPLKRLDTLSIAYVEIGRDKGAHFYRVMERYARIDRFAIDPDSDDVLFDSLLQVLQRYNLIIAGYHATSRRYSKAFGITSRAANFLFDLAFSKTVVLDVFGSPYSLERFPNPASFGAIVVSYDNSSDAQDISAQLIFGGTPTNGALPVTAGIFPRGTGVETCKPIRLAYALPAELGVDARMLSKIDSVAYGAIAGGATPGMQILAAKDGVVFFNRCYGKPVYFSHDSVGENLIYDLASITKIAATLPEVMRLYDAGKLDLNGRLGDYLNLQGYPDKAKLALRDILTHQSGLKSWIPFYIRYLISVIPGVPIESDCMSLDYPFRANGGYLSRLVMPNPRYFDYEPSLAFPLRCADKLYTSPALTDSIYRTIDTSALVEPGRYLYSDLGFIYLKRMVEKLTGEPLNRICYRHFYRPLGMTRTLFNPLEQFNRNEIAPTEYDILFRKQLVWGDVHDPAAALMGGVSGHAGLFSTANDLAKLMQMYLQKGEYGGQRFIAQETIDLFTSAPYKANGNRRALGFDKPAENGKSSPAGFLASPESFGHSGFTGTITWADPQNGLLYVFLSNRVHPDASNNLLARKDIRTQIHDLLYRAVESAHPLFPEQ